MYDGASASRRDFGPGPHAPAAHPLIPILLVAIAIFLIVLILARAPLQGYVVSQRVQAAADRAATNTPLATEQVTAWLRADAVLASTVQQVCPRDSLAAQNDLVHDLARNLEVIDVAGPQTRAGWQVNLPYHDRQLASRLLTKLSESLTSQLKHLDQAETQLLVQHYQKMLVQIREEEDSARLALERARHEQLTVALQNVERTPIIPTQPNPTPALSNPAKGVNPAWLQLQQQVDAAQAKLDQLLTNRTLQHPQVIEAQSRLQQLQSQLEETPRLPGKTGDQSGASPTLRAPDREESARNSPRVTVRLVSSSDETNPSDKLAPTRQIQQLTAQWSNATARRTATERSLNEAQQQWVRGLNAEGWEASTIWTQSQQGGRTTPFQLLLAGTLALIGGVGMWRLVLITSRTGLLSSKQQLQEQLPLPVLGEVPLSTPIATKIPAQLQTHVLRLSQLSLAIVLAVVLVCTWATSCDPNLSAQFASDPLSAIGQAFDLLHHRVVG